MIQVKCGKGDAGVKLLGSRVSLSLMKTIRSITEF